MKNDRSGHERFTVPRLIWDAILVTAMLTFWLALSAPAGAQDDGPPPARDYVSREHFESQADAQEALDSGLLDENGWVSLDGAGDGIACEIRWGEPAGGNAATTTTGVTTLPKTGSGSDVETTFLRTILTEAMALTSGALLVIRKQIAR